MTSPRKWETISQPLMQMEVAYQDKSMDLRGDGVGIFQSTSAYIGGHPTPIIYTYNSSIPNQLHIVTAPNGSTMTYSYDNYGNVTSTYSSTLGASRTLTYDAQERLINVTNWDGSLITFTYNAQGQRASYTVTPHGTTTASWLGRMTIPRSCQIRSCELYVDRGENTTSF